MRKFCLLILLLLGLAGCKSISTPLQPSRPERADDPLLCPNEQRRKSRYLLAYPDLELGPKSGAGEVYPPVGPHNQ